MSMSEGNAESGSDKVFTGAIPEIYDRLLVPLIFDAYARDTARRVEAFAPKTLLEIAAGTGAVTRELGARLTPGTRMTVTDLNQPMLDIARSRQPRADDIDWRQADALSLPFDDESFDMVVCQFGVMFFPDKKKGYREAYRVLRPGVRYLFTVWDKVEENEFPALIEQTLAAHFRDDPPAFLSRTPHGHWDTVPIRATLEACGFRTIEIETVRHACRAASARDAAVAYCQGTPLRMEIETRAPEGLEAATAAVEQALVTRFGTGPITGRLSAVVITATC
jgi:ubiquinone/menaquinone biosynthesis C-methylase UbiE